MRQLLYSTIVLLNLLILFSVTGNSQTSIKFKKQPTSFLYSQLNLSGGLINQGDGYDWKPGSKGIRNRLTVQGFFRSGKTLQKGYIRKFSIRNACVAASVDYDPFYYGVNRTGAFQLRLMDNWIGFGTKKRRVNFFLGNKRVEYGHSPRIDAESNFMNRNSLQVRDLGFWWDLGWFFKAPLRKDPNARLDITLQVSSGGWLFNGSGSQGTIMFMGVQDRSNQETYLNPVFGNLKYNNTFLTIAQIGRPTYKTSEFGVILVAGNIRDQFNLDSTVFIDRIGVEHIYKIGTQLKIGNQITLGTNHYQDGRNMVTSHMNNSIDYNFEKRWVFSFCQYTGLFHDYESKQTIVDYSAVASFGYIIKPDVKLRINGFYDREDHWNNRVHKGVYLQLVAGIGKRP